MELIEEYNNKIIKDQISLKKKKNEIEEMKKIYHI